MQWFLQPGETSLGRAEGNAIRIESAPLAVVSQRLLKFRVRCGDALGGQILPIHCVFKNHSGVVSVSSFPEATVAVNGRSLAPNGAQHTISQLGNWLFAIQIRARCGTMTASCSTRRTSTCSSILPASFCLFPRVLAQLTGGLCSAGASERG